VHLQERQNNTREIVVWALSAQLAQAVFRSRKQHRVLFKHISAAHLASKSKAEIIYVPPSTQHVQHVSFAFDLVDASSSQAARARNSINCQLGLLLGLANLRTVRLDFILQRELDVLNLERPVHTFAKAIETIRDTSRHASFALIVRNDGHVRFESTDHVISGILRPFRNARLDKLVLDVEGDMLENNVDKGEAYQAIMEVAPRLRTLSLMSVPWFGWYENDLNFDSLDTLDLSYGNLDDICKDTGQVMTLLRGIQALVRSCGSRLSKLILDLDWSHEQTDIALTRNILSGMPKQHLSEIWLRGSAILYVEDWLPIAQIKVLHVDMSTYPYWHALHRLLENSPAALEGLQVIRIYYRQYHGWEDDTSDLYPAIRKALNDRGIVMHFHVELSSCGDVHVARNCLEIIKDEVTSLSLSALNVDYTKICEADWPTICMPRLSELSFSFEEDFYDQFDQTAQASTAFGLLLARITALSLETLKLHIETPYTTHLHDLINAIQWKRHPDLKAIEGHLGDGVSGEGWHETVRAQLKKRFLAECKKREISVSGLVWE
jgi:hypothetical protein